MNYRTITDNGSPVSTLALGGNIFGYACDESQTREILLEAEALGVNFVDTADVYSDGRSEEMIGNALEGRRDRWVIATKVGVHSGATGHGIGAKRLMFERIEHSLRRLRTDYIDIYQLHHFDPVTPVEETLAAAATLQAQGKIRHFGISNCTPAQVDDYASESRALSLPMPATHQVHYNLLKRQIERDLLPQSANAGLRLLAYGVLGRGVLSGKYGSGEAVPANTRAAASPRVRSDLQPAVLRTVAGLARLGGEAGLTLSQLSVAYVLRTNTVAAALVGVRSLAQLREIARACDLNLSQDFFATVDDFLSEAGDFPTASLGQQPPFPLTPAPTAPRGESATIILCR